MGRSVKAFRFNTTLQPYNHGHNITEHGVASEKRLQPRFVIFSCNFANRTNVVLSNEGKLAHVILLFHTG